MINVGFSFKDLLVSQSPCNVDFESEDPGRKLLEIGYGASIKSLFVMYGLIEHDTSILVRLRPIVGDRSISGVLDEAEIQFAEKRIRGIRAELNHAPKMHGPRLSGSMQIISSWAIICFTRRAGRLWGRS